MGRYLNRRRALWGLLVLLALIVACGPGEFCESDQAKDDRQRQDLLSLQITQATLPPTVTKLEAKLTVPVTTFTVTAVAASPATPMTYEWSMTGEGCGSPVTPWKQTGPSVKWSHSDQKPDA